MTVNEMIAHLQYLAAKGYGDTEILNEECESVYRVVRDYKQKNIIIYFGD